VAISPRAFSRLALANFVAMVCIIATGAAVRLTGSGLGCPDWPNCFKHQLTAPLGQVHSVIEDANRLVTVLLVVLTVLTVLAALLRTPRRNDLVWLSAGLVGGVVADAMLGAIVVYTKLNPWLVSGHMALSLAMVVLAGVLFHRATHRYGPDARHERRCPWTVPLARWLWVAITATLVAGMATTGSGPHSGGSQGQDVARRLPFALHSAAWVHSVCAVAFLGIVAGAFLVLERTGAAARVTTVARRLLVVGAAQGLIGIVQYATHLPALLVELHVLGAVALTIGVLQFQLAQVARDREVGLEHAAIPVPAPSPLVPLSER
jgi:heme a synthase